MGKGTHEFAQDPRNDSILINVNGVMTPRAEATISVFDSGFMLGDGVWEGLRVLRGKIAFLEAHMDRLYEGAKAIAMDIGLTRDELTARLDETIDGNGMRDAEGVHIRLMVTRGIRSTPYQDPRVVISPATIVIIPEYKAALPAVIENGIRLFTVHVRRGDPAVQDQKSEPITFRYQIHASGFIGSPTEPRSLKDFKLNLLGCSSPHFIQVLIRVGAV